MSLRPALLLALITGGSTVAGLAGCSAPGRVITPRDRPVLQGLGPDACPDGRFDGAGDASTASATAADGPAGGTFVEPAVATPR